MALVKATPALVIRYSHLWRREPLLGQEEGLRDRPCAVVMMVQDKDGRDIVTVLPVPHSPPQTAGDAIEIPADTKRRLGLEDASSWVVLTEANRFAWPGPDLRSGVNGEPSSIAYGAACQNGCLSVSAWASWQKLRQTQRRSFHEPSRGWRFKQQE